MPVTATITEGLTVVEVPDVNAGYNNAGSKITIDGVNDSIVLNGSSTPPATQAAAFSQALTSGAATIDLRALVGSEGRAIDGNGLKVRACKFRNPIANANPITLTFGASNGYLLLGTAWKIILSPGQSFECYLKDGAPAIDGTHKTIDLAGTGAQTLDCLIVLG